MNNIDEIKQDVMDVIRSFESKHSNETIAFALVAHHMGALAKICEPTSAVREVFPLIMTSCLNSVSNLLDLTESEISAALKHVTLIEKRCEQLEQAMEDKK